MKHNYKSLNFAVSMTLFTVFALFMMLVLLMGAASFKNVSAGSEERYAERTPLLYVSQKIRGFDSADSAGSSVKIDEIDDVPVIVLSDDDFDIYIYYHDGFVKEFLVYDGIKPDLKIGMKIIPAQSMNFEFVSPKLIRVEINDKSVYVSLTAGGSI